MANFDQLEIPAPLKPIQPYLKTGKNYQAKDIVVSYWCRLYALQTGLKLSTKTSEETTFLLSVMDWLEQVKKSNSDNESITNEIAAQAYIENWAYKLFHTANANDRASKFNMSLVLSYYTAGLLYDVLTTFGELTEENTQNRKFAQWRATYINNCLKNGETPEPPGPLKDDDDNTNESIIDSNNGSSSTPVQPMQPLMPTMPNVPPLPSTPPQPTPPTNIGPFQFPSPPVPQQPQVNPAPAPRNPAPTSSVSADAGVELTLEQSTKAKKYIKWAGSALDYDDTRTAILNLKKALTLLETGVDPA